MEYEILYADDVDEHSRTKINCLFYLFAFLRVICTESLIITIKCSSTLYQVHFASSKPDDQLVFQLTFNKNSTLLSELNTSSCEADNHDFVNRNRIRK